MAFWMWRGILLSIRIARLAVALKGKVPRSAASAFVTIPFGFNMFRQFLGIIFQLFEILCLAKDH